MKYFIVAIPLFDQSMTVEAYRLSSRNAEKLFGTKDDHRGMGEMVSSPMLDLLERVGVGPFSGDMPLLVEINEYQLLMGFPINFNIPARQIICVLPADLKIDKTTVDKLRMLRAKNYNLAIDGVPSADKQKELIELSKYIILDYASMQYDDLAREIARFNQKKTVVISNIPNAAEFGRISRFKNTLCTGNFYANPITRGARNISAIKVNALALLSQVNEDDFDLLQVAGIIERDPSLSISLMRSINASAMTGGVTRKIDSIRGAVAILGQKEVRRWATVAISMQLSEDKPSEITKLSLVRARFAENLATAYEMGMLAPSLFLAGLFSLLDVVLQMPMSRAIQEVAVDERVRRALVDNQGELFDVLSLVFAYERADWDRVSVLMLKYNLSVEAINEAFIDALVWYKDLLTAIDTESDD